MDKIKNVAQHLGIITVEDMERYTALELITMIANKVNELIQEVYRFEGDVSDVVKTQNDNIQYLLGEGLHLEVATVFENWMNDGTFDTLINHSALRKVNERIDETNAQLSQKLNQNSVLSMANLGQDVKEAMTGGSVAVVGDNGVLENNIVDESVSLRKLSGEVKESVFSIAKIKLDLTSGYVNTTGEFIATQDGLIMSTEKLTLKNSIRIDIISNKTVEIKVSTYNDDIFVKSVTYNNSSITISKDTCCIVSFKYIDGSVINNTNFYSAYRYIEKINKNISSKHIDGSFNLLKGLTVYENKNVVDGMDLDNFKVHSLLVDSSVAYVFEPLQIRDGYGLIYDELYLSKLNQSSARQILMYDVDGKHVRTIMGGDGSIQNEFLVPLSSDVWYIVIVGYSTVESKDSISLHVEKKKLEWLDVEFSEVIDDYKYPMCPMFGHEYMYSWYEKLYNNENVVISVDGDSTTEEGNAVWQNGGRRVDMINKIMTTIGKYPTDKLTINRNGYGARTTGTWVGAYYNNDKPNDAVNYPNGTLDKTMAQNPDLIIFGYGINDSSTNLFPNTSIEFRLNQSRQWLEEGLKRIRGNEPVNGRPAYNKSADELAIILCTPITAENGIGRGRDIWNRQYRQMVMELARKYHCAFYDVSIRHYDHMFSGKWSQNNTTTSVVADFLHPRPACNADFMSGIQDLLFPLCLWKW